MSKRQKQTALLKTLILHGNAVERQQLVTKICKAERDEHCTWCALWLVMVLSLLSVCGLCYSSVFLPDFFRNPSQLIVKVFCVLGIASVVCSVVFMACWLWYRGTLNHLHEESRHFIMTILESQSKLNRGPFRGVDRLETAPLDGNHATSSPTTAARHVSYWELFRTPKGS